ncbi:Yip1 family protein [Halomicroarcula sp. GCM10025709]|uniref:Yip1 family protein n=1 Tax=Haloarcula TaxID=2237 RepID=UPI0024C2F508|nr:Yip1 family protein [Halomicroarcula sp. YJ-61-S]
MAPRLLTRPRQFFTDRETELNGVLGAGLAVLFSLVLTSIVGASLWLFGQTLGAVGAEFWQAVTDALPLVFLAVLVLWFVLGVALFLGAKLGGGRGTFGATLEVTAWGLLPTLLGVAVVCAALVVYGAQADLAVDSLAALGTRLQSLQTGFSGLAVLLLQIGVGAWQAFLWAAGLRVAHDLDRFSAVVTAVVVAVLLVVLV